MSEPVEYWYRVEETTYSAGVDEFGVAQPGGPTKTNLLCFRVLSTTPKGVWLEAGDTGRKLVCHHWAKQYACPTVETAVVSYKARKKRQLRILNGQISRISEALRYLDDKGFYTDSRKWML